MMNEESKVIQIPEDYFQHLKLSQMRAEICKMAMNIENVEFIESCHYLMRTRYLKECDNRARTIEEMAEDTPNNLLFAILSLFEAEKENTTIRKQVIKYFGEEIELRVRCGLLLEGNMMC